MRTSIRAQFVVGFDGRDHVLLRNSEVVFEEGTVLYVGSSFEGHVDRVVDGGHALVSPGFIDLDALGDIDHSLFDSWIDARVASGLKWSDRYFHSSRHDLFTPLEQADIRRSAIVHLLRSGITTVALIAAETYRAWAETSDEFVEVVRQVSDLGVRAYLGPSYRSGVNVTRRDGMADVLWDPELGERGLDDAIGFAKRFDGSVGGRVRTMLAPARVETCTTEVLRRSGEASREIGCPLRIHAAQAREEVNFVQQWYRTSPIRLLNQLGVLGKTSMVVHSRYADDVELSMISSSGTSIVHCPLTSLRAGISSPSLRKLLNAGINIGLGTDTFPPDMIRVMEQAWCLAKVVDQDRAAISAADVFRAATLGGAAALGREDLGRLCPGARADITMIDLSGFHVGPTDDPIRTALLSGSARDIKLVVVDGRTVVDHGNVPGVELDELAARSQQLFDRYRDSYEGRDWLGRPADVLFAPSFREVDSE